MKKETVLLACFAVTSFISGQAFSGNSNALKAPTDSEIDAHLHSLELALLVAPIKSKADLSAYLLQTPAKQNPLNAMTPAGRKHFLDSLTYGERGLSSFNYAVLESELSYSQAYRVLALFGMQHLASSLTKAKIETPQDVRIKASLARMPPADYMDYKCESRGTCTAALEKICTSNC